MRRSRLSPRHRFVPVALLALVIPAAAPAQDTAHRTALSTLAFRELGPAIMGGRVTDIAAVASDPATFYVGFATGGLWKTTSHGSRWTPLFDEQPNASIGAVALAPSNPNVVYVGTGAANNRQSSPYGTGVFRSVDGGRHWTRVGLDETHHIGRIVVHPRDPDIAYVAAAGHLWGPNPERGVYRTTDGGATWEKVLYIDENTGAIDLVMDPGDPNTLFAALYQRRRTPWGFSADGAGSGIYRTLDGGENWQELSEGLPEGDLGRIGLDIYRGDDAGGRLDGAALLYALVESSGDGRGLYRSTDRGETWEKVSDRNPRPMYFSLVRIDPSNPERIWIGGVSLSVSDDGGRTWRDGADPDGVHSDHHALWIDPNDSDHVIIGNDGGVYSTWDSGESWHHHNNLAVGQFYQVGFDMREPYRVCGGLQDNANWCGPSRTLNEGGIRNRDWSYIWGGDGFYNVIDPSDPSIVYTESQNGNMGRFNLATGEATRLRPVARPTPDDTAREYRFNWNAPIHISWHDPATIYLGGNHLMRSRDRGQTWEEASPDLTRAIDRDTLPIMGMPVDSTTLSLHDGVSDYGTIVEIGESPIDPDVVYAGTDDGVLQVTRDGGRSWTDITENVPGLQHGMIVSAIEPSRHVPGRVYLAFDGHFSDDYRAYAFVSENYGEDWTRITEGLPEHPVNVIREHPRTPALLFLGNEVGLYVSFDGGRAWERLDGAAGSGRLPTVPVDDIQLHPRENDLIVATHGRSIWILDDVAPLEAIAREPVLARAAHLFPVRPAVQWSLAPGGWFPADAYAAENPPAGVRIRYWLREGVAPRTTPPVVTAADVDAGPGIEREFGGLDGLDETERRAYAPAEADAARSADAAASGVAAALGTTDPAAAADDSAVVRLQILDADGRVIRNLEGPATAGIQEVIWDFRIDPPYEPERRDRNASGGGFRRRAPRGPLVLPGSYAVRLIAAGDTMRTEVVVEQDPRIETPRADLVARYDALMRLHTLAKPLYQAGQAAREAAERLDAAKELLKQSGTDADAKALLAEADSLARRLDAAREALGEAGAGRVQFAIEGVSARPTTDQLWQIDRAWEKAPAAIRALNDLLTGDFAAFEAKVYQPAARPEPLGPIEMPTAPAT